MRARRVSRVLQVGRFSRARRLRFGPGRDGLRLEVGGEVPRRLLGWLLASLRLLWNHGGRHRRRPPVSFPGKRETEFFERACLASPGGAWPVLSIVTGQAPLFLRDY